MNNEFVVWDNKDNKFVSKNELRYFNIFKVLFDKPQPRWSLCFYIGKTDIDNKKIYADSSIVELKKTERIPYRRNEHEIDILTGYFTYSETELRYKLIVYKTSLQKYSYGDLDFNDRKMSELKIIDTIQENKLGLLV